MNLTKALNSTHKTKRIGRGQGSGMGKTATKGGKGQTARKGYNEKRGFEGGQQPLQRRLPKVGFSSKFTKPYVINVEKIKAVKDLAEISFESLKSVHKFAKSISKIKLIGIGAKELASKIKDENISVSGANSSKKAKNSSQKAENSTNLATSKKAEKAVSKTKTNSAKADEIQGTQAEQKAKKAETKVNSAPKASKASTPKNATNSAKAGAKAGTKVSTKAENSAKKATAVKKENE